MPLPQPFPASEVLSCSPFPEEEAVGAHRPESPLTVQGKVYRQDLPLSSANFGQGQRFYSCWKYTAKKGKASRILKKTKSFGMKLRE